MTWDDHDDHDDHDHTIAEMALTPIADEAVVEGAMVVRLLAMPTFHRDLCITIRGRGAVAVELVVPSGQFRAHLMEQRGWLQRHPEAPTIDLDMVEAPITAQAFSDFRKIVAKIDRADLVDVQATALDGMTVRAELRDGNGYLRFAAWGTSRDRSPAQHRFLRAVLDLVVTSFAAADSALIRDAVLPLYRYLGEKPPS